MTGISLTKEFLDEIISYNKETGILTWKERQRHMFRRERDYIGWNKKYAGKSIGVKNKSGYLHFSIQSTYHSVHRIAWIIATGKNPEGQIDHINHDKLDNRLENLRDVTASDNRRNQRPRENSLSGVLGVYFNKKYGNWVSRMHIRGEGKYKHLITTDDFFEACCARKSAEVKYSFHKNHGITV